jgi:polysaccharide export outer membrane protein
MTMDRALAMRGGLRAEERSAVTVLLYRAGQRYALRGSDVAVMSEVVLRDGDSLVVDPGRSSLVERDLYTVRLQENVEPRDRVFITGEVAQPRTSELPVGRQAHLSELLLDAGGVSPISGDLSRVYVIRTYGNDARAMVYRLDASNVVNLALATQMELRPFDIVFVSEQPVTVWARVLSQGNPSEIVRVINASR